MDFALFAIALLFLHKATVFLEPFYNRLRVDQFGVK
jgi:hypothetical protein